MTTNTVALLKTSGGKVSSVWSDAAKARARADGFNADPFIDGEPDPDAPYTVEEWSLIDMVAR